MPFTKRRTYDWQLRTRTLPPRPPHPHHGHPQPNPPTASPTEANSTPPKQPPHLQALKLLDEGADILDIGGELHPAQRHPHHPRRRTIPHHPHHQSHPSNNAPKPSSPSTPTTHPPPAAAIEAGAEIVNDVSGPPLRTLAMPATCASLRCGTILMHTRGTPQTWPTLPLVPEAILPLVLTGLLQSIAIRHLRRSPAQSNRHRPSASASAKSAPQTSPSSPTSTSSNPSNSPSSPAYPQILPR